MTASKQAMSERTAAAIGRGIAEGKARALRGEVVGAWKGTIQEMYEVVTHDDEHEREKLAAVAHHAACRRWAELVLQRASKVKAAAMVLGDGDAAVGLRLADGGFAWPGDRVEYADPVTGSVDSVPWVVGTVLPERCEIMRYNVGLLPMFGDRSTRRLVSAAGMAKLKPWRAS